MRRLRLMWLIYLRWMLAGDIASHTSGFHDAMVYFSQCARLHGRAIDRLALRPQSFRRDWLINFHSIQQRHHEFNSVAVPHRYSAELKRFYIAADLLDARIKRLRTEIAVPALQT